MLGACLAGQSRHKRPDHAGGQRDQDNPKPKANHPVHSGLHAPGDKSLCRRNSTGRRFGQMVDRLIGPGPKMRLLESCLLYTSDAADE